MRFKDNTKLGKICFCIAMFILLYIFMGILRDLFFPLNFYDSYSAQANNSHSIFSFLDQNRVTILITITNLSIVNFILGIITLFQKGSNKKLAVISLLICSPSALACIVGTVNGLMIRFGM